MNETTSMPTDADVLAQARSAYDRAYAPYSGFAVGAAIVASSGVIYVGCNVENASYGLTICAERAAICAAVLAGERAIVTVAVVTDAPEPTAPCGACRQVLTEFGPAARVIMGTLGGASLATTVGELLPHDFSPMFRRVGRRETRDVG